MFEVDVKHDGGGEEDHLRFGVLITDQSRMRGVLLT